MEPSQARYPGDGVSCSNFWKLKWLIGVLGFYLNLPIGGFTAAAIFVFYHTPKHVKTEEATWKETLLQMDFVGVTLAMGCIICYILSMQYAGVSHPWNSSIVIGLIVGFVLLGIVFAIWEYYQGERASIPWHLFKHRNVWVNALYAPLIGGSYFLVIYYLPIYFQSVDGVSPVASGVRNLALIIAVAIAIIISGGYISKTGIAPPIMVGCGIIATIGCGLLYTLDIGSDSGKWIGYQVLGGIVRIMKTVPSSGSIVLIFLDV